MIVYSLGKPDRRRVLMSVPEEEVIDLVNREGTARIFIDGLADGRIV
jgi:hypothetical protein